MSDGRQICAYCRTELSADALVCDACGMTQSLLTGPALKPAPPVPGALTGPALRPPPEPPVVTAPTLLPPPEPPPAPAADPSVIAGGNPLASGAFPAVDEPPAILAGDPLAGPAPPPAAPPPPAPSKPPVVPFAAPPPPAEPDAPAPPPPPEPPAAEDPHDAHPSDETPPGYVTAASLWKISAARPDRSPGEPGAGQAPAEAGGHREAASVAPQTPAAEQSHIGDTRHSFPALAPKAPAEVERKRDEPPVPPNRSRIDGRTAAIVAVVVALAAIVTTGVVLLTGGSEPERAQAPATEQVAETETPEPLATTEPRATPVKPDLDAQVQRLDALMRFSKQGRTAAVDGDMKAAIANRSKLLAELRKLDADDKAFQAAVTSFAAAIRESLRQNRECASKCSAADLDKVGKLKRAALAKINPLLKEHGGRTYKGVEI